MAESDEVVEPLHLELEDREVYLAKIPVRLYAVHMRVAMHLCRRLFSVQSVLLVVTFVWILRFCDDGPTE